MFGTGKRLEDHIKECKERYDALRADVKDRHRENKESMKDISDKINKLIWLALTGAIAALGYLAETVLKAKGII